MKFQISQINQKGYESDFTNSIFQSKKTNLKKKKIMNFEETPRNNSERMDSPINNKKNNKQLNIRKTEDLYCVKSLQDNVQNIINKNNLGYFRSLTNENHLKIDKKNIGLIQNKILSNLKINNNKLRKILLILHQNKQIK